MKRMERIANLLLGSALDFLAFRGGFNACARDGKPLISRAPASSLRALRRSLIAALFLVALLPGLAIAAPPSAGGNPSVTELEQLVQTLKNDKGREAFVAQLDALIAAQRGVAAKPAEPEDPVSVLSDRINALGDEVLAGAAVPSTRRSCSLRLRARSPMNTHVRSGSRSPIRLSSCSGLAWSRNGPFGGCSRACCRVLRLQPGSGSPCACSSLPAP